MKKTKKSSKNIKNRNDERFARKVICQILVCTVIYIVVLANSRLNNPVSVQINERIKQYLCVSVDFKKTIKTVGEYFENILEKQQTIPVNTDGSINTKESN